MSYIIATAVAVLMLGLDQLTKYIVSANMELGQTIGFIDGFLDFTYIHNEGGAWGVLEGYRWVLLGVTAVVMLLLVFLIIKIGRKSKLFFWAGALIISGGLGNMIDRIFNGGKVVDFLHATFINFPIFNVADCAVVIGAGLLMLYFVLDTIRESKEKSLKESIPEDARE